MSLSSALASANSGLVQSSIRANVAASNVANASTPGYAAREAVSSENVVGGVGNGVSVIDVSRSEDTALTRLRRDASSSSARSEIMAEAYNTLNTHMGEPGSGYGLFASFEDFQGNLELLATTPESEAMQNAVVAAAKDVASQFNTLADGASDLRSAADDNIATAVDTVNAALYRLRDINTEISGLSGSPGGTAAIEDERQGLLDTISEIIPIKDIERSGDQIDVITESGVFLLAGTVSELSFSPTAFIDDTMRLGEAGSPLSGLTVGEANLTPGSDGIHAVTTGALSGYFAVRDEVATEFIDSLDAVAADIVTRLSDDSLDATKLAGDPGIFTDNGNALDPTNTIGLASRLAVNSALDPSQGGKVSRIRDGVGAVTNGPTGESSYINAVISALETGVAAPADTQLSGEYGTLDLVANVSSVMGEKSFRFDTINASATTRLNTLSDAEIEQIGVDTDFEVQNLLVIEQAYAANARVIQTVSDMIDRLLQL